MVGVRSAWSRDLDELVVQVVGRSFKLDPPKLKKASASMISWHGDGKRRSNTKPKPWNKGSIAECVCMCEKVGIPVVTCMCVWALAVCACHGVWPVLKARLT